MKSSASELGLRCVKPHLGNVAKFRVLNSQYAEASFRETQDHRMSHEGQQAFSRKMSFAFQLLGGQMSPHNPLNSSV